MLWKRHPSLAKFSVVQTSLHIYSGPFTNFANKWVVNHFIYRMQYIYNLYYLEIDQLT